MLEKLRSFFRKPDTPPAPEESFKRLNELAPLRTDSTATVSHSFVCREPVLNRDGRISGYEFLLHQRLNSRLAGRSTTIRRAYDDALILNLSSVGVGSLLEHRLAFASIAPVSFGNPQLYRLPATNTVLMLDPPEEDSPVDAGLLDQLRQAKEQGFHIGYRARPEEAMEQGLLELCDFVRISTPTYDGLQLADWVRHQRKMRSEDSKATVALIAADIETTDDFQICFRAGFDYFHGPFVARREDWHPPRSQIDSTRVMQILSQLRAGVENAQLAENIRLDAVLTYKLLRYINSAANGLQHEIKSIDHGLVVLGRERFYRWLSLLLFDVQKAGPLERVLIEEALVRASLMERLGRRIPDLQRSTDPLFLTGLFSLLDQLMGRPMEQILADVALPEPVVQALVSGIGPLAPCFRLAVACEAGNHNEMAAGAAACGVDPAEVNQDLVAALVWANSVGEVEA